MIVKKGIEISRIARKLLFPAIIVLPFVTNNSQSNCSFISKVQDYQKSVKLNFNAHQITIDSLSFNLDNYLKLFDKLVQSDEVKFHLYYNGLPLNGAPIIYTLPKNIDIQKYVDKKVSHQLTYKINSDPDLESMKELYYYMIISDSSRKSFNFLKPENSDEGYFQYLYYYVMGENFALFSHALDFQKKIICTKDDIPEIIKYYHRDGMFSVNKKQLKSLNHIDPTPLITSNENRYLITWYELETHNGLYQKTYEIDRQYPYKIRVIKQLEKLKINKNFMY